MIFTIYDPAKKTLQLEAQEYTSISDVYAYMRNYISAASENDDVSLCFTTFINLCDAFGANPAENKSSLGQFVGGGVRFDIVTLAKSLVAENGDNKSVSRLVDSCLYGRGSNNEVLKLTQELVNIVSGFDSNALDNIRSLKTGLADSVTTLQDVEKQVDSVKSNLIETQQISDQSKESVTAIDSWLANTGADLRSTVSSISNVAEAVSETETKLDGAAEDFVNKVDQLTNTADALQDATARAVTSLSAISQIDSELLLLKDMVTNLSGQITEVEETSKGTLSQSEALQRDVSNMSSQITMMNTNVSGFNDHIGEIQLTLSDLVKSSLNTLSDIRALISTNYRQMLAQALESEEKALELSSVNEKVSGAVEKITASIAKIDESASELHSDMITTRELHDLVLGLKASLPIVAAVAGSVKDNLHMNIWKNAVDSTRLLNEIRHDLVSEKDLTKEL